MAQEFRRTPLSLPGTVSFKSKKELLNRHKNNVVKLSSAFPRSYTKAGYLDVRRDITKSWKRRYFVLNNNFLLCASTPHAKKLEAVISLEGSNTNISTSDMTFSLKQRKTTLYFRAPSPKECKIWTKQIQKASTLKIKDIYRFLSTLGTSESQMTKVVAAQHRTTNEDCAIKIIDKRTCDRKMLNTEIKILKKLRNPNIVQLHDIFETKTNLYIVMERCNGGELFDQIVNLNNEHFTETDACNVIHQVGSGMKYMHDVGIIHRDLKPENILCVYPNSIQRVKLADFGISKVIKSSKQQMKTLCGTLEYKAPEILRGKGYDKSVDYWSIGVIMYILLCGYPPFWGENESELSYSILNADIEFNDDDWGHITKPCKVLVSKLLNKNAKQRATVDDIINFTWKIISKDAVNNIINKKAFPRKVRNIFKQTVIKRKIFRKSMGDFETSNKHMNTIGYHNQLSKAKMNAFQGRRGSKGLEFLELQLPMNQRLSFVGQSSPIKNITPENNDSDQKTSD